VPAVAGVVQPGPQPGGAVVIGTVDLDSAVIAYRADGRRQWASVRTPGCGNCDDGPQARRLQPDGTYGPIGPEGDDTWAVDPQGRIVQACTGVVLADGTCIQVGATSTQTLIEVPFLAATRGGAMLWQVAEPDFSWISESGAPPAVVQDAEGTVYTAYGLGTTASTRAPAPGRLIAVDAATGALRSRTLGTFDALAGLESGVLASTSAGLVALGADGAQLWTSTLFAGQFVAPGQVFVDAARHQVYVGGQSTSTPVTAFDTRTGAVLWQTAPADGARLLSLGASGTVYVATDRGGGHAVRAIGPEGRGRWVYGTATRALGAGELSDGTVAVSTEGLWFTSGALLTRIDPHRLPTAVRQPGVALSRSTVRTRCSVERCDLQPAFGTVMRLSLPRAAMVTVRILTRAGRAMVPRLLIPKARLGAPAGMSYVRLLFGEQRMTPGRYLVEASWQDRGRRVVRRIPVTVTR
jgi:hypothetical protein